jgi:iron(III) transport system permease protein
MGLSRWQVLQRVHLPLLRGGMLSAVLLVFVEVMKELPATLVLRPFNLDTLATQVFVLAADERLAEAAVPSLMIVAAGLLPVVLLTKAMRTT